MRRIVCMTFTVVFCCAGSACSDTPATAPTVNTSEDGVSARRSELVSLELLHGDGLIAQRFDSAGLRALAGQDLAGRSAAALAVNRPSLRELKLQIEALLKVSPRWQQNLELTHTVTKALTSRTYREFYSHLSTLPVTQERMLMSVDASGNERSRTEIRVRGRVRMRFEEIRSADAVARAKVEVASSNNEAKLTMDELPELPCYEDCGDAGGEGGPMSQAESSVLYSVLAVAYSDWQDMDDYVRTESDEQERWWNDTTAYPPEPIAPGALAGDGVRIARSNALTWGGPCGPAAVVALAGGAGTYGAVGAATLAIGTATEAGTAAAAAAARYAVGRAVGTSVSAISGAVATFGDCAEAIGSGLSNVVNSMAIGFRRWRGFNS